MRHINISKEELKLRNATMRIWGALGLSWILIFVLIAMILRETPQ